MSKKETFLEKSEDKSFDLSHRKTIQFNIGKYNNAVSNGSNNYINHELGRDKASHLKNQAIHHLDKYLIEFEYNREFPYLQYHIELSLMPYYKKEQLTKYFCKLIKKNQK